MQGMQARTLACSPRLKFQILVLVPLLQTALLEVSCQPILPIVQESRTNLPIAITSNYTKGEAWFYATESQPPHQATNFTAYETAATRIWPVLLIQANNDTKTFSTQMSCLRAKNAAQGSHEIGDVPGAGSHVEGVWWSLAAVFAVMGFLM